MDIIYCDDHPHQLHNCISGRRVRWDLRFRIVSGGSGGAITNYEISVFANFPDNQFDDSAVMNKSIVMVIVFKPIPSYTKIVDNVYSAWF